MKRKIVHSLLICSMMVSLIMFSVAPIKGQEIEIKTDVAAQTISTEQGELYSGIIKETCEILESVNCIKPSISKREDSVVCTNEVDNEYSDFNKRVDLVVDAMNIELASIENITDKKEYLIAYKELVDKYSYILDPPEMIYDILKEEELDLLFSVVQAEVGDEYTFEQKCNVASVIYNRLYSNKRDFKQQDTLLKVLTKKQFETISNGRYKKVNVSEETILACEYVFLFGDITGGALFFDSNSALKYKYIFNDGAHNFYTIGGK